MEENDEEVGRLCEPLPAPCYNAKLHAVIMLTYSMKEPNNYDNPEAEELTLTSKQASQQWRRFRMIRNLIVFGNHSLPMRNNFLTVPQTNTT